PGIVLYLAVALPWYVAVELRNPEFFRVFILEHNLARFSHNLYHHPQPFWFYLPVFLLAIMPWAAMLIFAAAERLRLLWSEGMQAFSSPEDSWPLFLLLWMLVPILFFSASQSKLPGYILTAVPAAALLVSADLARRRAEAKQAAGGKLSPRFAAAHSLVCGLLLFSSFSAGSVAMNHHLPLTAGSYRTATLAMFIAIAIAIALRSSAGPALISRATVLAVVVSLAAIIRFAAPVIDATQSARPIAESIQAFSREPVPIALYRLNRVQEYGLEFYLNRPVQPYEGGNIPAAAHVVVATQGTESQVAQLVPGRRVSYLTSIPEQKVDLYWVGKE